MSCGNEYGGGEQSGREGGGGADGMAARAVFFVPLVLGEAEPRLSKSRPSEYVSFGYSDFSNRSPKVGNY